MFELIWKELYAMGPIDWTITVTALLYVLLAARNRSVCFVFGAISCALWGYVAFAEYQLYLDALLQFFYVGMSFYGIYVWQRGSSGTPRPITGMSLREHALIFAVGIPLSLAFGYFFGTYTEAAATYFDAFTTIFAVLATFLVVQRKLENWLYWIVLDLAMAYLYWTRAGYFLMVLMIIYTAIALWGYQQWKKETMNPDGVPQPQLRTKFGDRKP